MHSVATIARRPGPAHAARALGAGRWVARAKDVVLGALAVIGVVSVLWLVAAWALHLSVIVFVTGSMAPTLPTGSAAVVQHVQAAGLAVGDIVTVPKPDSGIPVTHRIVDIATVSGADEKRELTLKGDANDIVDPSTYIVSDAERVLAGAPGVGWLVVWSKSPAAMIALTLGVALAIVWALWPSRTRADS